MQKVTVSNGVLGLSKGAIVKLTADQAKTRAHALKAVADDGTFEATADIQFRKGETLSLNTVGLKRLQLDAIGIPPAKGEAPRKAKAA